MISYDSQQSSEEDGEEELREQYRKLIHAVQSGIEIMMNIDAKSIRPKYLKTGINLSVTAPAAVVDILIRKEVITREEYLHSLIHWMKREVVRYEKDISERLGREVKLTA